jgi:hypothetical protein
LATGFPTVGGRELINLADARNRKVVRFIAQHDKGHFPLEESAFYPPIEQLTTHPDVIERVWKDLGAKLPADCARFVHRTPCLVHDRSGIILAFGWGTAYAIRLPRSMLEEALASGATPIKTWTGGRQTDLSRELGDEWLWGSWFRAEPDWLASSYQHFASTPR